MGGAFRPLKTSMRVSKTRHLSRSKLNVCDGHLLILVCTRLMMDGHCVSPSLHFDSRALHAFKNSCHTSLFHRIRGNKPWWIGIACEPRDSNIFITDEVKWTPWTDKSKFLNPNDAVHVVIASVAVSLSLQEQRYSQMYAKVVFGIHYVLEAVWFFASQGEKIHGYDSAWTTMQCRRKRPQNPLTCMWYNAVNAYLNKVAHILF